MPHCTVMKVALICNSAEQIGIQHISAALKQKGHQTRLFLDPSLFNDRIVFNFHNAEKIFSMRRKLVEKTVNWQPDLIGITTVTITFPWAKDIAAKLKHELPQTPIIAGGPHAIMSPEVIIAEPFFDIVCTGEGEHAVVELADAIRNNTQNYSIPDLWFKKDGKIIKNPLRNLTENLDSLPRPDRSVFEPYFNMSDSLLSMSMRGCLMHCAYCSHNVVKKAYQGKGKYVRRKSVEGYISELIFFKERYNYKFVRIYDDIFTHDKIWLEQFSKLYKKQINVPFFCLSHPRYLDDDSIHLIKEAGCRWIQVGIESLNEKTRKYVLNRPESNDEVLKAIKLLEKYQLRYELDFIFGLPGDNENTYQQTIDVLKHCRSLNRVSALTLSYLPKTEIIGHSLRTNEINLNDVDNIEAGLEGCQTGKGSIRNRTKLKLAAQYNLLYRLCAFLNAKQIDFINKIGLCSLLRHLNPFPAYLIRLLGIDTVDKIFIKLTLRHFIKVVFFKNSFFTPQK